MSHTLRRRSGLRPLIGIALGAALVLDPGRAPAQNAPRSARTADSAAVQAFMVNGRIALHALMALSDAHLQKLADILAMLATSDAVRSGDWERMRGTLAAAAGVNVPAALWFAEPDGGYWTTAQGRATANLADRPYFSRLLAGKSVVGDLVVSRSTRRNVAIVAVPLRGSGGSVVGVLGGSVHLDSLSTLLREEMGGLDSGLLFFAMDSQPLGAIHSDSTLIFTEPMRLGDAEMRRAFTEMLASQEGVVTYAFRGSRRTVLYRRSPVTGWWYGLGNVHTSTATRDR